jgi:hypothetical protein
MRFVHWLAPVVVLLVAGPLTADPASAAGASMQFSKVFFEPGPSDPLCSVALPGGAGAGSGTYTSSSGEYKVRWEWNVPQAIVAGAGATTKVTVDATGTAGWSGAIALKPPSEFGVNAGSRQQIEARVPVGETGSKTDQEAYTFTPTREYNAGEKLYIRMDFGCASVVYEYVGVAATAPPGPPSPCRSGRSVRRANGTPGCVAAGVNTPAPGKTTTVSSPLAFGAGATSAGVTVNASGGSLGGTTIVGSGGRTGAQATGEAVAACWLIGPDALTVTDTQRRRLNEPDFKALWAKAANNPSVTLRLCILLVRALTRDTLPTSTPPPARAFAAQAGGCNVKRLVIRGKMRKRKVVSLKLVAVPTPKAVRYACAAAGTGTVRITATGKLKSQLGPKLALGVVRQAKATATASKLTFGFGNP